MATFNLDDTVENQDWTKAREFDLPLGDRQFIEFQLGLSSNPVQRQQRLVQLAQLPIANDAAPKWLLAELDEAMRTAMLKGDYVGHPFRGNQWMDASGVSRGGAESSPDQDAKAYAMRQAGRSWEEIATSLGYANGGSVRRLALRHEERLKQEANGSTIEVKPEGEPQPAVTLTPAVRGLPQPTDDILVAQAEGRPHTALLTVPADIQAKLDARDAWMLRSKAIKTKASVLLEAHVAGLSFKEQEKQYGIRRGADGRLDAETAESIWLQIDPSFQARIDANVYPEDADPAALVEDIATAVMVGFGATPRTPEEQQYIRDNRSWERGSGEPSQGSSIPEGVPYFEYETVSRNPDSGRREYKLRRVHTREFNIQPLLDRGLTSQQIGELYEVAKARGYKVAHTEVYEYNHYSRYTVEQGRAAERELFPVLEAELKDARVSVTVTPTVLSSILRSGSVKTQFETGTSRGYNDTSARASEEATRFGFPPEIPADKRPVYGMVEMGGVKVPSDRNNLQYGNVLVVLKSEVAERTTITAGDSLSNIRPSAPMKGSSRPPTFFGRFGPELKPSDVRDQYLEATVHGGVKVADISHVVIQRGVQILNRAQEPVKQSSEPSAALLKALDKAGIPYQIVDSSADIKAVGKARWFLPTLLLKGDYVGHPFRGNQWMDASGARRGGAAADVSADNPVERLKGVSTLAEALREGRPLAMLQPENYSPKLKELVAVNEKAKDLIQTLFREIAPNSNVDVKNAAFLADKRVVIASTVLALTEAAWRMQLQHEYSLANGLTVAPDQTIARLSEEYSYIEISRNMDGRLERSEETAYPNQLITDWANTRTGFYMVAQPDGTFTPVWSAPRDQFSTMDQVTSTELRTGEAPAYGEDDLSGKGNPSNGPLAVAAAQKTLREEALKLGLVLPKTATHPKLTARPLFDAMVADGKHPLDARNDIGLLIAHIQRVGISGRRFHVTADMEVALEARDMDNTAPALLAQQRANITPDTKVSVTVPANKVGKILKDGRLKTQFETGKSGGKNDATLRADFEATMFGYPRDMDPAVRPIYGMLETGGPKPSSARGNEQYGTVTLVLKDSVKERTTFTVGDSLSLNATHVPVADAGSRLAQTRIFGSAVSAKHRSYYESQIHGGVRTNEIERVIIDTSSENDAGDRLQVQPSAALIKALTKANIPFEVVDGSTVSKGVRRIDLSVVIKGDYVGHPFRGNQWTDASGAARGSLGGDLPEREQRQMKIEAIRLKLNEERKKKQDDVQRKLQEFMDKDEPVTLVVSQGSRFTAKVSGEVAEFETTKGKRSVIIDDSMINEDGRERVVALSSILEVNPMEDETVEKGDFVGHPFRGNQWMDASGASRSGASGGDIGIRASGSPTKEIVGGVREYRVHPIEELPDRWAPTLFINGKPTTLQGTVSHFTKDKAERQLEKFKETTDALLDTIKEVKEVNGRLAEIKAVRGDGRTISQRIGWGEEGREEALREYTSDSVPINQQLRAGKLAEGPLDPYMTSGPAVNLWRTISNDNNNATRLAASLEAESMIADRGYASTSTKIVEAQQMDAVGDGILLNIRVPSGYPRVAVPQGIYAGDQSEVILPRGTKMRLVEARGTDDEGRRVYIVDVVDDDTAQSLVEKGDYVGHPFRGNQWMDANGVSRMGAESSVDQDKQAYDLRQGGKSWEEIAKIMGYANGGSVRRLAMRHEKREKSGTDGTDAVKPVKPDRKGPKEQAAKISDLADPTSVRGARKLLNEAFGEAGVVATLQALLKLDSSNTLTADQSQLLRTVEEAGALLHKAIQAEIAVGSLGDDAEGAVLRAAAISTLQNELSRLIDLDSQFSDGAFRGIMKAVTGTIKNYRGDQGYMTVPSVKHAQELLARHAALTAKYGVTDGSAEALAGYSFIRGLTRGPLKAMGLNVYEDEGSAARKVLVDMVRIEADALAFAQKQVASEGRFASERDRIINALRDGNDGVVIAMARSENVETVLQENNKFSSLTRDAREAAFVDVLRTALLSRDVQFNLEQRAANVLRKPINLDGVQTEVKLSGGETVRELRDALIKLRQGDGPTKERTSVERQTVVKRVLSAAGVVFAEPSDVTSTIMKGNRDSRGRDLGPSEREAGPIRAAYQTMIDGAVSLLPRALVDGSMSAAIISRFQGGAPLEIEVYSGGGRAHATNLGNGKVRIKTATPTEGNFSKKIAADPRRGDRSTMLHEIGHGIEYANPFVRALEWLTYTERRAGEKIRSLNSIARGSGYRSDEKGVEDEWRNTYAGKSYGAGRTSTYEIFTTGLQALMFGDQSADDRHMAITLAILASSIHP